MILSDFDELLRMFMKLPLWIRIVVITILIACVLIICITLSFITILAYGFRDGCFNGGPGCDLPLIHKLEMFLIPASVCLLIASLIAMMKRSLKGYRWFALCVGVTLLQALIPGNHFFSFFWEMVREFFW
jgi:hypothetical protein